MGSGDARDWGRLSCATVGLAFALVLQAEPLPEVAACPELEAQKDALLKGSNSAFFFVNALGGDFPVPSFLKVEPPAGQGYYLSVRALDLPGLAPGGGSPDAIRARANSCGWMVNLDIGARNDLGGRIGGGDELQERVVAAYRSGATDVLVLRDDVRPLTSMLAVNDAGYAHFLVQPKEAGFWLVNLFTQLQEQSTE